MVQLSPHSTVAEPVHHSKTVCVPRQKSQHVATKTWYRQINKYFLKLLQLIGKQPSNLKYILFTIRCYFCTVIQLYMYNFSDSFPLYINIRYWIQFPVLYSKSLLFIYLILLIYPSPIPTFPFGNHKFVFCLWICFCLINKFICISFHF